MRILTFKSQLGVIDEHYKASQNCQVLLLMLLFHTRVYSNCPVQNLCKSRRHRVLMDMVPLQSNTFRWAVTAQSFCELYIAAPASTVTDCTHGYQGLRELHVNCRLWPLRQELPEHVMPMMQSAHVRQQVLWDRFAASQQHNLVVCSDVYTT